jgi:hypothetical protein
MNIISPNWDSVDMATIFFASISFHAVFPARVAVIVALAISILFVCLCFNTNLNRVNK